ncbi:MAG: UDP-2,4-diacetamido-2,4,6-trideoxy-beta-L-altropyranose hydrolase [Deltaproteobacteria bacterium]|nr:UDP-2,4-diacetamido-2,4,6-trideoxy-beta-L-altropyranose hydrolase [Deltaproteobacteria bacterium]
MDIIFRTDASIEIGSGHVMRCLALADGLKLRGLEIGFICRDLPGHLGDLIERKGYPVILLSPPDGVRDVSHGDTRHSHWLGVNWEVDTRQTAAELTKTSVPIKWLIVDHYALDYKWEAYLRSYVKKIMVIDDLADRHHECDLIVDQNLYHNAATRYDGLIPVQCKKMTGPQYAMLRREFREARKNLRKRDGSIRGIHVFFGGTDEANETTKAIQALVMLQRSDIHVDVVVGENNPHGRDIELLCQAMPNFLFHRQVDHIAFLMMQADLAIGSGGTTTWERCCLGVPAVVAILGENQRELTYAVENYGAIINMGDGCNITPKDYFQVISNLKPDHLVKMSELGMVLVDGEGTLRVADEIEQKVKY